MRTKGSARFSRHFKLQEYDRRSAVWIDVQKSYTTAEDARAACRADVRCRVMEITECGRAAPTPRIPRSASRTDEVALIVRTLRAHGRRTTWP